MHRSNHCYYSWTWLVVLIFQQVTSFSIGDGVIMRTTPWTRASSSSSTQLSVMSTTSSSSSHRSQFGLETEYLLEMESFYPSKQQQQQSVTKKDVTTRLQQKQQQVTWIDLPRHSYSGSRRRMDVFMVDLELLLGRIAIVLAILLPVMEWTTGQPMSF